MRALAACRSHFMLWHVYGQPTPPPSFSWIIGIRGCAKPSPARPLTPVPQPKLYKSSPIDTDSFTLAAKVDCRCLAYYFLTPKSTLWHFWVPTFLSYHISSYSCRGNYLFFFEIVKPWESHIVSAFRFLLSLQRVQRSLIFWALLNSHSLAKKWVRSLFHSYFQKLSTLLIITLL